MRKNILGLATISLCFVLSVVNCFAATLLSKDQALSKMFPDVDEVITKTLTLSDSEVASIKERLGGELIHYQKGSKSDKVSEATTYNFLIGVKNGKNVRMAVVEEQPGKWGPVEFIIAIDTNSGKVNNLAVMSYTEKRGRPIARRNFLKQFFNKGSSDPISVRSRKGIRRDIRAISGATISSDCTCFAVKKVLALYEKVYVNMKLDITQNSESK